MLLFLNKREVAIQFLFTKRKLTHTCPAELVVCPDAAARHYKLYIDHLVSAARRLACHSPFRALYSLTVEHSGKQMHFLGSQSGSATFNWLFKRMEVGAGRIQQENYLMGPTSTLGRLLTNIAWGMQWNFKNFGQNLDTLIILKLILLNLWIIYQHTHTWIIKWISFDSVSLSLNLSYATKLNYLKSVFWPSILFKE